MANDRGAGRKRKLTPLEEADVMLMHQSGKPMYEIVTKYKLSESTLRRVINRLGKQGVGKECKTGGCMENLDTHITKCTECHWLSPTFDKEKPWQLHKCLCGLNVFGYGACPEWYPEVKI